MSKVRSGNFVVVVAGKNPRIKKLSEEERVVLYVLLIICLGSFAMMIYSFIIKEDSNIWHVMFASIVSAMGGFLIGANRRK